MNNKSPLKIDVWYGPEQTFGHNGIPSRFINIPGRVTSGAGVQAMRWQLNDGPVKVLPLGPSAYRLLAPGDFNVEIEREKLVEGKNILSLFASDMAGKTTDETVTITYTGAKKWPLPCTVDWSKAENVNHAAQVIDGKWNLTLEGLHCPEIGYDRLVAMGDISWTDYEVTVPFMVHRFSDNPGAYVWPSHGSGFGPLIRWQGHADWHDIKPNRGYLPHGCIGFYWWHEAEQSHRWQLFSGSDGTILARDEDLEPIELKRWYVVKMAVESQKDKPSIYRLKYWPKCTPEPANWLLEAENGPDELTSGSLVLVAHHTEITYGNVEIKPLS